MLKITLFPMFFFVIFKFLTIDSNVLVIFTSKELLYSSQFDQYFFSTIEYGSFLRCLELY